MERRGATTRKAARIATRFAVRAALAISHCQAAMPSCAIRRSMTNPTTPTITAKNGAGLRIGQPDEIRNVAVGLPREIKGVRDFVRSGLRDVLHGRHHVIGCARAGATTLQAAAPLRSLAPHSATVPLISLVREQTASRDTSLRVHAKRGANCIADERVVHRCSGDEDTQEQGPDEALDKDLNVGAA